LEKQYKGKGAELIPSKNTKADGLFEQGVSIEASNFDPYASEIVGEKIIKKYRFEIIH
jgi:glutathione S-transferase